MLERDRELQQVSEYWSTCDSWMAGSGLYWYELPEVQRQWNARLTGHPETDWVDYTLATHLAGRTPLARCLSLGCGKGWLERRLAAKAAFTACDACDVAEGSIREARRAAQSAGYQYIHYALADLNTVELPPASYDAVWAAASVHHVAQLDHLFSEVAQALRPDGLLVLNEYIGPNRFQFPPRQRQIIQACNDLLPDEYRRIVGDCLQEASQGSTIGVSQTLARRLRAKLIGGDLLPALWRRVQLIRAWWAGTRPLRTRVNLPTAHSVIALDPSEAVRSAEILPVLRQHFDIVDYRPLGGAILQYLLADIAGNFESEGGARLVQMLFNIEDVLMASGDLPSDFAYIVARPRPSTASERCGAPQG